jgi:hypothetical protein
VGIIAQKKAVAVERLGAMAETALLLFQRRKTKIKGGFIKAGAKLGSIHALKWREERKSVEKILTAL